jgi:hypothetical protein
MLKMHPSRYGLDEFMCCKAKIWHDFSSDGENGWIYYYKPAAKNNNTLQPFF